MHTNTKSSKIEHNGMAYTEKRCFSHPISSEGFSVKLVTEGTENYFLNGSEFAIGQNECFISNVPLQGEVYINSKTSVKGLCLNISYQVIKEVEESLVCNFGDYSKQADSILSEELFEVRSTGYGLLRRRLNDLHSSFVYDKFHLDLADEAIYYSIGEAVVLDLQPKLLCINNIQVSNIKTRKDLANRLIWAKDYLESCFTEELQVKELAKTAAMSEYHFSRMFKQAFGLSPYQYQLKLKMELAKKLISQKEHFIQDIAPEVGYSDIFTFSKAFKKYFGVYPSRFLK